MPAVELFAAEARELVRLLQGTDVAELDLTVGDLRVSIKRGEVGQHPLTSAPPTAQDIAAQPNGESETSVDSGTFVVTSPVVGWFRRARGAPGGPPLIEEGQEVTVGQALAIIEAVQVVHEVTADRAGRVESILVADGQGVEYGQPLVRLRERA